MQALALRACERFVLEGALLLLVWLGETSRPTGDADLLAFGEHGDGTALLDDGTALPAPTPACGPFATA